MGTKCSNLVLLDSATRDVHPVSLPPSRPGAGALHPLRVVASQGIHALALNCGEDLLVTGGSDPHECVVCDVETLKPSELLRGHLDLVFGAVWVTDRHLVTGSRDHTVKLWRVGEGHRAPYQDQASGHEEPLQVTYPIYSVREHKDKVRAIQYCASRGVVVTVSTDGQLIMWDPQLLLMNTWHLHVSKELTCLAVHGDVIAVGVSRGTVLLDRRCPGITDWLPTLDESPGVRSLSIHNGLLTCGTSGGSLVFYDLRAVRGHKDPRAAGTMVHKLKLGPGMVAPNELFRDYNFGPGAAAMSCYSHCWHPSGTSLFACGGPLPCGLRGCYMAWWR